MGTLEEMQAEISELSELVQVLLRRIKDLEISNRSHGIGPPREAPKYLIVIKGIDCSYGDGPQRFDLVITDTSLIAHAIHAIDKKISPKKIGNYLIFKSKDKLPGKCPECTTSDTEIEWDCSGGLKIDQFTTGCASVDHVEEFKAWYSEEMEAEISKIERRAANIKRMEDEKKKQERRRVLEEERKKLPMRTCKNHGCDAVVDWFPVGDGWRAHRCCKRCHTASYPPFGKRY